MITLTLYGENMRISRRTSGGRGEYEISEPTADGLTPNDLVGNRILLDLGQGLVLDTATVLKHAQGKFRLRRIRPDGEMQLHRQVVAALLLPEAIRSNETMGGGEPIIQRGRYAIETIQLAAAPIADQSVCLSLSEIIISNRDHAAGELHIRSRLARIK